MPYVPRRVGQTRCAGGALGKEHTGPLQDDNLPAEEVVQQSALDSPRNLRLTKSCETALFDPYKFWCAERLLLRITRSASLGSQRDSLGWIRRKICFRLIYNMFLNRRGSLLSYKSITSV